MKTKSLLLVGLVVVLGSCSTAYRSGQTPDDVYYSPAPAASESYIVTNNSNDRDSYSSRNAEERDIRRGINDPRYRSTVTFDVGYGYNPFGYNPFAYNSFGYNPYGYNSFGYNPYSFNNYGNGFYNPFGYNPYYSYNPYYPNYGYNSFYGSHNSYYGNNNYYPSGNYYPVGGRSSNNTGPRKYNLGAYTPSGTSGVIRGNSTVVPNRSAAPVRSFNRATPTTPIQRERTGVGNVIQRVFTPSEPRTSTPSNRRTFSNPPTRSTQPSNNNRTMERRSNNTPAPTRSFDPPARSTPPPAPTRSFDPPASSTPPPATNNSSAPVRTFKNN